MRPKLIVFALLLVAACKKTEHDTVSNDTMRTSVTDTAGAAVADTPAIPTPTEKFAILNPTSGDTLVEGRTYVIRWTAGPVRQINLGAAMGGHDKGFMLNNAPSLPDSLVWKVPIGFVTGFGPPSSNQVRLRLENADSVQQWAETGPLVVTGTVQR